MFPFAKTFEIIEQGSHKSFIALLDYATISENNILTGLYHRKLSKYGPSLEHLTQNFKVVSAKALN